MPQRRSGIQELRLSRKKHSHNLDIKTELKKTLKEFRALVDDKKLEEAKAFLSTVYKKLDKAAKRHILPVQAAARKKSFFTRLLSHKA